VEQRRKEIAALRQARHAALAAKLDDAYRVKGVRRAVAKDGVTLIWAPHIVRRRRMIYKVDGIQYETRARARAAVATRPDPDAPATLGWRVWAWREGRLVSPVRHTVWPEDGILEAEDWSDEAAVRGVAGIHARRMPLDWRRADPRIAGELDELARQCQQEGYAVVDGIVECWGRVLHGTEGWRAQFARIIAVRAPTTEIGLAIEAVYPTIRVYYPDQIGEEKWKLASRLSGR
jgi:hypothetical protein